MQVVSVENVLVPLDPRSGGNSVLHKQYARVSDSIVA